VNLFLKASVAAISLAAAVPQLAAASLTDGEPSGGGRVYTPEDFARFSPKTALDMLVQAPGFVIRREDSERGLGEASGNVLLNGKRLSGKSDDILSQIGRIPAGDVVRIEIIDGAKLNISGLSGQVANIITKSKGLSGRFMWRPEWRLHNTRPLFSRFEVSASGKYGPVEYTLALENRSSHGGADGPTYIYDANRALLETRIDQLRAEFDQPKISSRFAIDGPGSSLINLNGSYRKFWFDYIEDGTRTGPGLVDRTRAVREKENGSNYEIGGDVEFALGKGRMKLIGLKSGLNTAPVSDVRTSYADGSPDTGDRFAIKAEEGETIARAEYRWKTGRNDWQLSGEAAFNFVESDNRLFTLVPNGTYPEVPLPGGAARISEDRYEAVATWGRPVSEILNVQLALGAEYSTLEQTGAGGLTRSFFRPKGQFTAAWKASPTTDINFKLQRKVGQLNFFDFLASVDIQEGQSNASNPNLAPPQSWEAEIEASRRFDGWGSTTLRVYAQRISDIVDVIPIGLTGEAIGNLDSADLYGLESKTTINFDKIGWKGAKLDFEVELQDSSVTDPLTGEKRPISDSLSREIEIELRHDIPGSDIAWGGGLFNFVPTQTYRLTEIGRSTEGPLFGNVFIEHKDIFGLTLRGTVGNLPGARERWDRTVFDGRRTDPVLFYLERDRRIGRIFSIQLNGEF
jgi:hypothetical protein